MTTTEQLIAALLANLHLEYQAVASEDAPAANKRVARTYISQTMELVRRARATRFEGQAESDIFPVDVTRAEKAA